MPRSDASPSQQASMHRRGSSSAGKARPVLSNLVATSIDIGQSKFGANSTSSFDCMRFALEQIWLGVSKAGPSSTDLDRARPTPAKLGSEAAIHGLTPTDPWSKLANVVGIVGSNILVEVDPTWPTIEKLRSGVDSLPNNSKLDRARPSVARCRPNVGQWYRPNDTYLGTLIEQRHVCPIVRSHAQSFVIVSIEASRLSSQAVSTPPPRLKPSTPFEGEGWRPRPLSRPGKEQQLRVDTVFS